jgi:ubiquitin-activating enzyme E1
MFRALMGAACSADGRVIVTDSDIIERSNLSRQFLFRNSDVTQSKARRPLCKGLATVGCCHRCRSGAVILDGLIDCIGGAADVRVQSAVAVRQACRMNPGLNAIPLQLFVGKQVESEAVFSAQFWDSQTAVVTALDNIDARLYVDEKCVEVRKPMLESGTQGTKGNTQVRPLCAGALVYTHGRTHAATC